MGRKHNRRGCRPLNHDVITDILAEGSKRPHPSPPVGSATFPATGKVKNDQPTEGDRAHARAVEVCDRIIRELDNQLPPNYRKED